MPRFDGNLFFTATQAQFVIPAEAGIQAWNFPAGWRLPKTIWPPWFSLRGSSDSQLSKTGFPPSREWRFKLRKRENTSPRWARRPRNS